MNKSICIAALLLCQFTDIVFADEAADMAAAENACLKSLKGVREAYPATMVGVSWKPLVFDQETNAPRGGDPVVDLLYMPVRKIRLGKPLDQSLEKIVSKEKVKTLIAPAGYFIAVGSDDSRWLLTVERSPVDVAVSRLKPAADESQLKLYCVDYDEPVLKFQDDELRKIAMAAVDESETTAEIVYSNKPKPFSWSVNGQSKGDDLDKATATLLGTKYTAIVFRSELKLQQAEIDRIRARLAKTHLKTKEFWVPSGAFDLDSKTPGWVDLEHPESKHTVPPGTK